MKMERFVESQPGRWTYLTGGITRKSLDAIREIQIFAPPSTFRFHSVRLTPDYPVDYEGHKSDEAVVVFVFKSDTGEDRVLVTDGFSWGYGGEGPMGLVTALNDICDQYDVYPGGSILREALRRWVMGCHQDAYHELDATTIPSTEFMSWR